MFSQLFVILHHYGVKFIIKPEYLYDLSIYIYWTLYFRINLLSCHSIIMYVLYPTMLWILAGIFTGLVRHKQFFFIVKLIGIFKDCRQPFHEFDIVRAIAKWMKMWFRWRCFKSDSYFDVDIAGAIFPILKIFSQFFFKFYVKKQRFYFSVLYFSREEATKIKTSESGKIAFYFPIRFIF